MISANLSAIFYLISGILFILALRGLSSPETSRQGNFFGILGICVDCASDLAVPEEPDVREGEVVSERGRVDEPVESKSVFDAHASKTLFDST